MDRTSGKSEGAGKSRLLRQPLRNIEILWTNHPFILISSGVLVIVILLFALLSMNLFLNGETSAASDVASLTSAFATILLAALTAAYVVSSKILVNENKKLREHREEEISRELESLRRGLLFEIDELSESRIQSLDYDDTKYISDIAPKTIFQRNADRIGMLTNEEVEAVMAYHHHLSNFEEYLNAYSNREGGGNIKNESSELISSKNKAIESLKKHLEFD